MTSFRINLALVGGLVLAAILSLIVALALLAGRTGATDAYYTVYGNVSGLKFGSQVLFEGYPVGQVESIEPLQEAARTTFRIGLSITQGWKIPDDSLARPVAPGVLAAQIISIAAGKSQTPLKPGDMITPASSLDLMSSISSAAGNLDQITDTGLLPLLENLNRQVTLLGEMLDQDLRPMARDLRKVAAIGAERLPRIAQQTEDATASLAAASRRIDQFLSPERVGAVDRLIGNVDRTTESLRSASGELDTLIRAGGDDLLVGLQDFSYVMNTLGRYAEPVGQNLDLATRDARDFSRLIRQNPGVLLRGAETIDTTRPPLRPAPESP